MKKDFDDLTRLDQIGPARQAFMRDVLNVYTYQDLAALSAGEIATAFQQAGKPISILVIEAWLQEAAELAAEPAQTQPGDWEWQRALVLEFCVRKVENVVQEQEIRIYPLQLSKKGDWLENGREALITLEDGDALCRWLAEQPDLKSWRAGQVDTAANTTQEQPVETTAAPAPKQPLGVTPRLTVTNISARQVEEQEPVFSVEPADNVGVRTVPANQPLALEAEFEISNAAEVGDLPANTVYKAQFYLKRAHSRELLGNTLPQEISPGQSTYAAELKGITLPPGLYGLGAVLYLRSNPPAASYFEIPTIHVQ